MPTFIDGCEQLELFGDDDMAKMQSRSEKPEFFAKGGDTKMFGRGTAHPAESAVSGKSENGGGDSKFAKGGSGKMFGKGHAGKKVAGVSGKQDQEG
jgi:hypothetical protein